MGGRMTEEDRCAITVAIKLVRLQYLLLGTSAALAGTQVSELDIARALRYLGEAWECADAAFKEALEHAGMPDPPDA
jgi:hypothetical protein